MGLWSSPKVSAIRSNPSCAALCTFGQTETAAAVRKATLVTGDCGVDAGRTRLSRTTCCQTPTPIILYSISTLEIGSRFPDAYRWGRCAFRAKTASGHTYGHNRFDDPSGVAVVRPDAAVNLTPEGLMAHTAIIAQSGSGKSFMLGRFMEEIASRTRARILVLDPNSDFGQFGSVAKEAWKFRDEPREQFLSRWEKVGIVSLTQRPPESFPAEASRFAKPVALAWPSIHKSAQANYIGVSLEAQPAEWLILSAVRNARVRSECPNPYTLDHWRERIKAMIQVVQQGNTEVGMSRWPTAGLVKDQTVDRSLLPLMTLRGKLDRLAESNLWDVAKDGTSVRTVQEHVKALWLPEPGNRVVCLDLGSIGDLDHRSMTAAVALESLWLEAQTAWNEALKRSPEEDHRCPVFIVLDEAHNLAPDGPTRPQATPAVETLVRIAMEGREYGLFLILVTQRPMRVNSNLLSQCDNLCLMKMSNPADVRMIADRFGFVPAGKAERALEYMKGQALIAGQFVTRPVEAKIAPRRTAEGGRSSPRSLAGLVPPATLGRRDTPADSSDSTARGRANHAADWSVYRDQMDSRQGLNPYRLLPSRRVGARNQHHGIHLPRRRDRGRTSSMN